MTSLWTVGAEADDDRIELFLSEVQGKDITELIASGREKLASVASASAAVAVAAPAGGAADVPAAAAAEPKKEEKAEEKEESEEVRAVISTLFSDMPNPISFFKKEFKLIVCINRQTLHLFYRIYYN